MTILTALFLLIVGIVCILLCTVESKKDITDAFYFVCQLIDEIWESPWFDWIFPEAHFRFCQWAWRKE